MRALFVASSGQPPQIGELPTPEPAEGEVLVRVEAAGLNPIDTLIAAGAMAGMIPHEYPLVIGRDAAGVVEAVGAGVDHVAVGDRVLGHVLLAPPVQAGTLAEYAVFPAAGVHVLPTGLDSTTAASIPLASAAATAAVDALGDSLAAGDVVLVNGASGGVGSFVVQLLAQRGVHVVATGTSQDASRLGELGAASILDFTAGPVVDAVLQEHPEGVDALVNLAGNTPDQIPLGAVKKGGVVSFTTMGPSDEALESAGLVGHKVMARATREVTGPIAKQVAEGALQAPVAEVLELERSTDGLATLASGSARGKIVVTF